jgi:hypothetical protein
MRTLGWAVLALAVISAGAAADDTSKLSGSALIDHWVKAKWGELSLKPSRRADDAEYMRRVYLDIVGRIPSLEEAEKFVADKSSSDKRKKLVDALVKDPRYSEHWADVWTGILVGYDNDQRDQQARVKATDDLKGLLAKNIPLDEFARQVVTVKGNVYGYGGGARMGDKPEEPEAGLASYIVNIQREAGQDFPKALAGKLTRVFMGVQIQCAQCHDHPFDRWTQEEFYGMASFFTEVQSRQDRNVNVVIRKVGPNKEEVLRIVSEAAKVTPKEAESLLGRREGVFKEGVNQRDATVLQLKLKKAGAEAETRNTSQTYIVTDVERGRGGRGGSDLSIPDSKSGPVKASFIDTKKGAVSGEPRRATFAKYLTDKENLQFAKMAVNRMWAHFFGAGIVNPVDDFNEKNKPTHPELLEALAKDFIAHGFDTHWLMKSIAASEAYNLTSRVSAKERDKQAEKYLAFAGVRALAPEQILRSVVEAAGIGEGMARLRERFGKGGPPPKGPEMRDRGVFAMLQQFRSNFADDEGNEVTEFAGTIPQALLMMNSQIIGAGTSAARFSSLGDLLQKHPAVDDRLRAIYMSCLTRRPTEKELSRWKAHVTKAGNGGYEDLMWTLLNTSEFLFNH